MVLVAGIHKAFDFVNALPWALLGTVLNADNLGTI